MHILCLISVSYYIVKVVIEVKYSTGAEVKLRRYTVIMIFKQTRASNRAYGADAVMMEESNAVDAVAGHVTSKFPEGVQRCYRKVESNGGHVSSYI